MCTGKEFDVRAKAVINATGPFTDSIRKMDDPEVPNICQASAGVHVILPGYYRYANGVLIKSKVVNCTSILRSRLRALKN